MCFSATASFTASAVLAVAGVAALAIIPKKQWLFFALTPFLFSLQQFFEGMIWLNGGGSGRCFLFFALIIWPIWIPLALWILEKREVPRRILSGLMGLGVFLAIAYMYVVVFHRPEGSIQGLHMKYTFTLRVPQALSLVMIFFYAMTTIVPFFVSSRRHMKIFGVLSLVTCLVALYFYTVCFVSVWCFFAAIASICVLVIMQKERTRIVKHRR